MRPLTLTTLSTILSACLAHSVQAQGPILPPFSGITTAQGAGMTRALVNTTGPEDLIYGVFSGGAFHYRVGFDLRSDGTPATLSPVHVVSTPFATLAPRVAQGADLAVWNLGGSSRPDLVLAINWAPAGANYPCFVVGWDLDTTGRAQSWSPLFSGPSLGWESQGAGCSIGDVNRNGRPDLVFMVYDNPAGANSFRYVIGWDLQSNGLPVSWSPMRSVGGVSYEAHGAACAITYLDRDPRPELILVAQDNGSGADTFRYRIGWNLDAAGVAAAWGAEARVYQRDRAAFGVGCYTIPNPTGDSTLVFASAQALSSEPEFNSVAFVTCPTMACTARRFKVVADVHCTTHTHEEGMFNDRDEVYFKAQERFESSLTGRVSYKSVRLSDPHPEDYFQFFNGRTLPGLTLWEGVLYPDDNAVLSLAMLEQDNSNLDDLLRILPSILSLGTGLVGGLASIPWLSEAADFGLSRVGDLVRSTDGREFIGGLGVSLVNQNGRIVSRFNATENARLRSGSFDGAAVSISMNGAGQYELTNLRIIDEPFTAGYGFDAPMVRTFVQLLHYSSPSVTDAVADHVMANNWDDAVRTLLGAVPDDSYQQQLFVRNLPLALREAARLQGYLVHVPDARADYDAQRNTFVASSADLARVRAFVDLAIARLGTYRLVYEVLIPCSNRAWDVGADEMLDAIYDAVTDVQYRDATLLVMQHMPYALRYLVARVTGSALVLADAGFFVPDRSTVDGYR
ncbi:MAG: hypothetical protein R3F56_23535 [Planctomycetota bacterium]